MERTMSATEARIHFGELIRSVTESYEAVIVERQGKPQVVVLPVAEYERLKAIERGESWRATLQRALQVGVQIQARRGGRPLPAPEEVIRAGREARDAELGLRR